MSAPSSHNNAEEENRHPKDGWQMADPYPLDNYSRKVALGVIRALLPDPALSGGDPLDDVVLEHVRRLVRYMHPASAVGLLMSAHLLNWAPLFTHKTLKQLHQMTREQGAEVLESVAHSPVVSLRILVVAVRGLVLSTYFDQKVVQDTMGYTPVPFTEQRIQLRQRLMRGEKASENDQIRMPGGL
jgi:hypothetical protein